MEDWEDPNDNAIRHAELAVLQQPLLEREVPNLWGTLHYLNQKGITTGIVLSFMGRVPPWMGGAK